MRENKYDDEAFFQKYSRMARSVGGLEEAGEWPTLKRLLPDFSGKRVLDLGCGYGWHCRYAAEHGAASVVGIDLSERMLQEAERRTADARISYRRMPIEDISYPPDSFDVVLSSLAFHYVASFSDICTRVYQCLSSEGVFIFSVEHPIFTAQGPQDWFYSPNGERLHWPVDRYFEEGKREAVFLGETVTKYHKTVTTYIGDMLRAGFLLTTLEEPQPDISMMEVEGMRDELRRPMMLIIAAQKR